MNRVEEILQVSATTWDKRPAVIDQRGVTSYSELLNLSSRMAEALTNAGVSKGSVVGIALLEAKEFLTALFATLTAECVAIPISPQLPQAEQERIIQDTGVRWIVGKKGVPLETFDDRLSLQAISSDSTISAGTIFPDAAVMRHTSGTTGLSKGVVLSHRGVLERTESSQQLLEVRPTDVVLAPLPLAYHFIASALSFLRAGATVIDCATLSPVEMLALGERHGATMIYGSPLQYELLSRATLSTALPKLRRAISTSALLPTTTANIFFDRFNVRLTQVYGIIEVGLPLWNTDPDHPPTILGRCMPPYECVVVGDDDKPVQPGEIGELLVRGPGLFSGYLSGQHAGTHHEPTTWFHTGDLVSQGPSGDISYKGRKKSVINSGGNKIFPEEVEEVLQKTPAIAHARVSAEPHPLLGSLIVAEVVLAPGAASDVDSWRALCYAQLSGFKVPKEFRVVDELPVTGSGKIVRHNHEGQVAAP